MLETTSLIFDAEKHEYTLNGVYVPSVTQVLRLSGYVNFDGVPPNVLEAARARGSRVHAALHYLLEDDLDLSTVDDADRGYLESFQKYRAKHIRSVLRVEFKVWSNRYACAGTTDIIAIHDDGLVSIDDVKTGDPSDVAADLQTAAYHGFVLEMASDDPSLWRDLMGGNVLRSVRRRSIRLLGDGSEARETLYPDHRDFARFVNALSVVHDQLKRPVPMAWDEER